MNRHKPYICVVTALCRVGILTLFLVVTFGCTSMGIRDVICGEGYIKTNEVCLPDPNPSCDPKCTTDQICQKGKCIERSSIEREVRCLRDCREDEKCHEGRCVPLVSCTPRCQGGSVCKSGRCVASDCIPRCPQFGYVCEVGECKKICVKPCAQGTICVDGICMKPCKPKCKGNEFCRTGKCAPIEDRDGDGYKNIEDCKDDDKAVNPGLDEFCDGKDNDCDGQVDNIRAVTCYTGASGTLNVGTCRSGLTSCDSGKKVCVGEIVPTKETKGSICSNRKDDNCDGLVDNECPKNP